VDAAEQAWRPLGELLVAKRLVKPEELEHALAEQESTGRLLGAILVERGYVSGPALAIALAEQYGVELKTERGFGTGLWAEIDRRHRAGRETIRSSPSRTTTLVSSSSIGLSRMKRLHSSVLTRFSASPRGMPPATT